MPGQDADSGVTLGIECAKMMQDSTFLLAFFLHTVVSHGFPFYFNADITEQSSGGQTVCHRLSLKYILWVAPLCCTNYASPFLEFLFHMITNKVVPLLRAGFICSMLTNSLAVLCVSDFFLSSPCFLNEGRRLKLKQQLVYVYRDISQHSHKFLYLTLQC